MTSKYKVLGQKMFICPRGFLADFSNPKFSEILEEFTSGVKKFLKRKGAAVLEISPNISRVAEVDKDGVPTENYLKSPENKMFTDLGYKALGEYEFVKWEYALKTGEMKGVDLLKHMRSGHRYATRLALERYQMRMRELSIDEIGVLKGLSDEAAERHGFVTPSIEYYREMKAAFSEKVKFFVAEVDKKVIQAVETGKTPDELREISGKLPKKLKDGVPVAAAMFVYCPNETIYLFSGSSSKYSKLGGPHFLQYKMIEEAIKTGVEKYNFYGTNPKRGDGVYEFKRGYHGELREYLGTFMLPISLIGKAYVAKQKYQDVRDIH